jgi:hypothetical protein
MYVMFSRIQPQVVGWFMRARAKLKSDIRVSDPGLGGLASVAFPGCTDKENECEK